jgi:hypothetical protein
VRIYYTTKYDLDNFLYAVNIPFLWAGIELATSIACTSAVTLKPLLIALRVFNHSSRGHSTYDLENAETEWSRKQRSGIGRTRTVIIASQASASHSALNGSAEEITWAGKDCIAVFNRTVELETSVTHSGPGGGGARNGLSPSQRDTWLDSS